MTLVLDLSERYCSEDMHKALTYLGRRRDQYNADLKAMVAAYVAEVSAASTDVVPEWNLYRRKVSKFFIRARVLCTAGLLDESLLAESLQKAAFDLCVDTVGPLDEAQNRQVLKRTDFDDRMIAFFRGFRERHFWKAGRC